jgi:hypothetical protein
MNRKLLAGVLAAMLCISIVGPATAKKKPKKTGPVTVFEDPSGDSGTNAGGPVPGTENGGFDLTKGSIEAKGKDLVYTVEHSAAMPDFGQFPETFRLLWHINVDGEEFRFTVKSVDVGKPDAQAGSGEERVGQVDTDGHFRLEQCIDEPAPAVLTFVNCSPVENGYIEGAFDAATGTVTWTLPMALVGAKKGSMISGGSTAAASSSCQICWVAHYAERSLTPHTIIDNATQTTIFKVP